MREVDSCQLFLNLSIIYFMDWSLIIVIGIAALALVIFLFVRNLKDEKEFESKSKMITKNRGVKKVMLKLMRKSNK